MIHCFKYIHLKTLHLYFKIKSILMFFYLIMMRCTHKSNCCTIIVEAVFLFRFFLSWKNSKVDISISFEWFRVKRDILIIENFNFHEAEFEEMSDSKTNDKKRIDASKRIIFVLFFKLNFKNKFFFCFLQRSHLIEKIKQMHKVP